MKTPIQEMILNIESIESKTTDQEQIYMLTALRIAALVLLKKEKEQICLAFDEGGEVFADDGHIIKGFEYYNQTYNQNI